MTYLCPPTTIRGSRVKSPPRADLVCSLHAVSLIRRFTFAFGLLLLMMMMMLLLVLGFKSDWPFAKSTAT